MQTNMFPSAYNRTVDERTNNRVNEAEQRYDSRVNSINSSRVSIPTGEGEFWAGMIGLFGGFIACSCVCISNESVSAGLRHGLLLESSV